MGYHGLMKKATISQTKNRLSALLDEVRAGATVVITDRDRPIARLEPFPAGTAADRDGRLARLERGGLLRRGRGGAAAEILQKSPPRPRPGGDILKALLAEREEGR